MKKSGFSVAILVGASLIAIGCNQQADPESELEKEASVAGAKYTAKEHLTKALQSGETAADEGVQAAKLSVTAAKLAVASSAQKDKEAAVELASKAESAAKRAEERIMAANSDSGGAINKNVKKAKLLAKSSVAATGEALAKAKASVEAGAKPDAAAAKAAALEAEKTATRAAAAAVEASKAAASAAKETWKQEMDETSPPA